MTNPTLAAVFLCGLFVAVGCKDESRLSTPSSPLLDEVLAEEALEDEDEVDPGISPQQKSLAANAKDALFEKLSGRLMEVMQSEGPVAAIEICSSEAVTIAEQVGEEQGVRIGRTSHKLRNPKNAPRDWVKPLVEQRIETPGFVSLEDGGVGAVFPIHLTVKCLMCHGQAEDILDAVKPELAKRYPDDQATGFKQGDLRGWFWVEVPADAG